MEDEAKNSGVVAELSPSPALETCERLPCNEPKKGCDLYCAKHHREWCTRSLRPRTYTFSDPEINHLLTLLHEARDSGDYYGQREQYYARTNRLIALLSDNAPEAGRGERSRLS